MPSTRGSPAPPSHCGFTYLDRSGSGHTGDPIPPLPGHALGRRSASLLAPCRSLRPCPRFRSFIQPVIDKLQAQIRDTNASDRQQRISLLLHALYMHTCAFPLLTTAHTTYSTLRHQGTARRRIKLEQHHNKLEPLVQQGHSGPTTKEQVTQSREAAPSWARDWAPTNKCHTLYSWGHMCEVDSPPAGVLCQNGVCHRGTHHARGCQRLSEVVRSCQPSPILASGHR
jgi:hypothetical protein